MFLKQVLLKISQGRFQNFYELLLYKTSGGCFFQFDKVTFQY